MKPYLDEMQYGLAAADFCVGRAGATFLAEITACGLPGILIPYPYAAADHQKKNAMNLAKIAYDRDTYAEAMNSYRKIVIAENFEELTKLQKVNLAKLNVVPYKRKVAPCLTCRAKQHLLQR